MFSLPIFLLACVPAFAANEREEPGLHACNHVIDKTNHDKIVQGLTKQWTDNNCDYHLPPPTTPPGAPRPGPIDPAKCSDLHRANTYKAAWENTELGSPKISPLLQGRVHVGDMKKHCGGEGNNRGDRPFLANNVRQIQNGDGTLPGGAKLQCVCKRSVDPSQTDEKGNPKRPLSLTQADRPPETPAARKPINASMAPSYVAPGDRTPPFPKASPPAGYEWALDPTKRAWVPKRVIATKIPIIIAP